MKEDQDNTQHVTDVVGETIVTFGSTVKLIKKDDSTAEIGGYLVRFRKEGDEDVDLYGDYFTEDTDFGVVDTSPVLYHHGMDSIMQRRVLGKGHLTRKDNGIWIQAQLDLRSEYERAVLELIEQGALGWSSGTASHLASWESTKTGNKITAWHLGLDASLTPTPAEYRNSAVPLKTLIAASSKESEEDSTTQKAVDTDVADHQETKSNKTENIMEETNQVQSITKSDIIDVVSTLKADILAELRQEAQKTVVKTADTKPSAPAILKGERGDNYANALKAYIARGDTGALEMDPTFKASNDTDMNVGTDADGGYLVPTGHYNNVIARRDEMMLASMLGCRPIVGVGTTVNVPIDNEDDGEFVSTNEAAAADRDAPASTTKAFTLVTYTKKIQVSYELLQDEASRLEAWLSDFLGRGLAKTHNNLLLTEVASNGTDLGAFASASAIAVGEIDGMVNDDALSYYMDEGNSNAWVMRPTTYGAITELANAAVLRYRNVGDGNVYGGGRPTLLGYPVFKSNKAAAIGASAKSVYFGNWNYVGLREEPSMTFLRDPYGAANTRQVNLYYYFRAVYGVLQSEAIGWMDHPSA